MKIGTDYYVVSIHLMKKPIFCTIQHKTPNTHRIDRVWVGGGYLVFMDRKSKT